MYAELGFTDTILVNLSTDPIITSPSEMARISVEFGVLIGTRHHGRTGR
jgi:hypothetical protein